MPATAQQLIVTLLFVLPGFTYQAVRARLKGPAPDERQRHQPRAARPWRQRRPCLDLRRCRRSLLVRLSSALPRRAEVGSLILGKPAYSP
jgi:hypothetical protein